MSFMRMVLAAVFVLVAFIAALFGVGLIATFFSIPVPVVSVLLFLIFAALVVLGMVLFDPRHAPSGAPVHESTLVSQQYHARRAFQVEELEDLGSSYFIELADGSVLFVTGQYLYEYEPIDDDPDENQPRRFPCTEFTVRRHPTEHWVYDIACSGEVLEPEGLARPFSYDDYDSGRIPENGQIITGRSYDEIKAQWLEAP
jgi:membrane protein implicated in regulation of membrane protease activity